MVCDGPTYAVELLNVESIDDERESHECPPVNPMRVNDSKTESKVRVKGVRRVRLK